MSGMFLGHSVDLFCTKRTNLFISESVINRIKTTRPNIRIVWCSETLYSEWVVVRSLFQNQAPLKELTSLDWPFAFCWRSFRSFTSFCDIASIVSKRCSRWPRKDSRPQCHLRSSLWNLIRPTANMRRPIRLSLQFPQISIKLSSVKVSNYLAPAVAKSPQVY